MAQGEWDHAREGMPSRTESHHQGSVRARATASMPIVADLDDDERPRAAGSDWSQGRRARTARVPTSSRPGFAPSLSSTAMPATRRRPRSSRGACCLTPRKGCEREVRAARSSFLAIQTRACSSKRCVTTTSSQRCPPRESFPRPRSPLWRPGSRVGRRGLPPIGSDGGQARLSPASTSRPPASTGPTSRSRGESRRRSRISAGRGRRSTPSCWPSLRPAGLTPSPPADRRTLLRRAYYDLIGLPPSAEEIEAFERDTSPRRLRPRGRSPARLAALWRTVGPALA